MPTSPSSNRTSAYKPALAWFAGIGTLWVFVLVTLGAFTTTIGAGMAFPDWPLSNGSLNPAGWLTEVDKFAEHSHRISAAVMGVITIAIAAWIWLTESRSWLRKLALFAVGLVIAQGVVGGLRVRLDPDPVPLVSTSLGRLFAMLHAYLAQTFVCTLIAVAVSCSRGWIEPFEPLDQAQGAAAARVRRAQATDPIRRAGVVCCSLLFLQLAIAAVMRHSFAGLAIQTFPFSTPAGGLFPEAWTFRVGIHFAHRVMAVLISIATCWFAIRIWRSRAASLLMRSGASLMISLVAFQILLGAQIIWTSRSVTMTTGHVLVSSFVMAITFLLTWLAHRDRIETPETARERPNDEAGLTKFESQVARRT